MDNSNLTYEQLLEENRRLKTELAKSCDKVSLDKIDVLIKLASEH